MGNGYSRLKQTPDLPFCLIVGETVFKAKNGGTEEDVPAVEESQDLEVERPLDQEEAKEVTEEEEGEEHVCLFPNSETRH